METGSVKTNAMRILESLSIPYTVHTYEWDEEHLDAIHAANSAGLELERVYKTIVMRNSERNLFVFCLPAEFGISLKKARAVTGSREIDLIRPSELLGLTGYIRGGCSPLGMKKHYATFISDLAELEETIYVSGGQRGVQIEIRPDDLIRASDAEYADFIQ